MENLRGLPQTSQSREFGQPFPNMSFLSEQTIPPPIKNTFVFSMWFPPTLTPALSRTVCFPKLCTENPPHDVCQTNRPRHAELRASLPGSFLYRDSCRVVMRTLSFTSRRSRDENQEPLQPKTFQLVVQIWSGPQIPFSESESESEVAASRTRPFPGFLKCSRTRFASVIRHVSSGVGVAVGVGVGVAQSRSRSCVRFHPPMVSS